MGGNVLPAMWSFMLAARARGLGTCWTTLHLMQEKAVAEIVGIPFDSVQQLCLSPLAYTVGTDFKPAARPDPDTIIHWDTLVVDAGLRAAAVAATGFMPPEEGDALYDAALAAALAVPGAPFVEVGLVLRPLHHLARRRRP